MSVSNNRHGHSHDEFTTGLRMQYQDRTIANTDVVVLAEDAAPVQYVTTTGTGPAVVRLPLAAKEGKIFFIRNMGTQSITVTDNAGSPVTAATIVTLTTGIFQKIGAGGAGGYRCIMEGAAIA